MSDASPARSEARVVLMPSSVRWEALGPLPPGLSPLLLEDGADPGPDARAADAMVFGYEMRHLVPRLAEFEHLRLLQTLNAGIEWLLPHVPPGVTVCNASGVHDIPVAEWVVASVLAFYKQLPRYLSAQAEGRWDADANALMADPADIPGDDLAGKRLVVVGHGSIGRAVEVRLAPFGAGVVGLTRSGRNGTLTPDRLTELAPTADVLVLLCPLTEETRGMVDARLLALLPDGAIVVNAARGPVVDQDALEVQLWAGRLRAALDVTDPEPLPPGHSLWSAPNLILTPHTAGSSRHWVDRAWRFAGDQLRRWAGGQPLLNVRSDY